jgi:hypothetical protein
MCACCKFVLTITIVFPLFGGSRSLDDGGEEAEGENPAALENEAELPLPGPAAAAPVHTDGTGGEEEDAIGAAMAGCVPSFALHCFLLFFCFFFFVFFFG